MSGLPGGGDVFGPYRIEGRVKGGGMGVVLRATHLGLDRVDALKLLSPDLMASDEFVERFRREAMALARLDSPHIVRVYDAGERDGWLYIATQLIPDGDLADLLASEGPQAPDRALMMINEVLIGLEDAHQAGLLHRDIKPENILVRRRPEHLQLYLCDLGISQVVDSVHTRTTGVLGTLGYLAPERHRGTAATVQSDLYSVGCLLWALVAGQAPFRGTDLQVALDHHHAPIPQLPGTSPMTVKVNEVLTRSLAKDPAARYASAKEMRAALIAPAAAQRSNGNGGSGRPSAHEALTLVNAGPVLSALRSSTDDPEHDWSSKETVHRSLQEPAHAPSRANQPAGRGRLRVVGAAIIGLVIIGALGYVLSTQMDAAPMSPGDITTAEPSDDESGAAAQPERRGSRLKADTDSRSDVGSRPTSPPAATLARCWDGSEIPVVSACSMPRGRQGLEWVFPSMTSQECQDLKMISTSVGRPNAWQCTDFLPDGTEVVLNYSQWGSVTGAYSYYDRQLESRSAIYNSNGELVLYRWTGLDGGVYKVAQIFANYPYGVTVYVPRPEQRLDALRRLVRLRPATAIKGIEPVRG